MLNINQNKELQELVWDKDMLHKPCFYDLIFAGYFLYRCAGINPYMFSSVFDDINTFKLKEHKPLNHPNWHEEIMTHVDKKQINEDGYGTKIINDLLESAQAVSNKNSPKDSEVFILLKICSFSFFYVQEILSIHPEYTNPYLDFWTAIKDTHTLGATENLTNFSSLIIVNSYVDNVLNEDLLAGIDSTQKISLLGRKNRNSNAMLCKSIKELIYSLINRNDFSDFACIWPLYIFKDDCKFLEEACLAWNKTISVKLNIIENEIKNPVPLIFLRILLENKYYLANKR